MSGRPPRSPSLASGALHAGGLFLLTGAGLLLGWVIVWRCVLSKLPQVQNVIRDILGLGDSQAKRDARERRARRRKERAQDTQRALRVAEDLKEKVIRGASTTTSTSTSHGAARQRG